MSFDLAVWFEPGRISTSAAAEKYKRLCDGGTSAAGVVANDAVTAFHRALIVDFPELPGSVADFPQVEASPWTAALDVSDAHVIMPISWSRADATAPAVLALAGRHGLVCFDPQAEVLHLPPALRGTDGRDGRDGTDDTDDTNRPDGAAALSLQPCVGLNVEDPDLDVIERAVRRLSAENWFLILEKPHGRYVQVGQGPNAGVPEGEFAVEHRDGSMERHYRCVLTDPDQVAAIFAEFASGAETWSVDVRWESMWA